MVFSLWSCNILTNFILIVSIKSHHDLRPVAVPSSLYFYHSRSFTWDILPDTIHASLLLSEHFLLFSQSKQKRVVAVWGCRVFGFLLELSNHLSNHLTHTQQNNPDLVSIEAGLGSDQRGDIYTLVSERSSITSRLIWPGFRAGVRGLARCHTDPHLTCVPPPLKTSLKAPGWKEPLRGRRSSSFSPSRSVFVPKHEVTWQPLQTEMTPVMMWHFK